jgi:2-haloalkanoic acid dehalogenase type II
MRLTDCTTLSFDCYGTLIDWETGLTQALRPLLARAGRRLPDGELLQAFARHEAAQQQMTPAMLYSELLTAVHARLCQEWGVTPDAEEGRRFGASVGIWPAFPDTAEALRYLKQHFQLVILSNVDRASFAVTSQMLGVDFDHVYTAQDIGSYKPDQRNFEYLISNLARAGIARQQILHVAQSLFHDHAPANAAGLSSAWIDRRNQQEGWGATSAPPAGVRYDFRFASLGEMADAHRALMAASPGEQARTR